MYLDNDDVEPDVKSLFLKHSSTLRATKGAAYQLSHSPKDAKPAIPTDPGPLRKFADLPQYRNSRTGAVSRSNRAQVENDTLVEGLPIRPWGKAPIRISNIVSREPGKAVKDDGEWPELPMPKDSHLYEPYTQHLLRIARRGRSVRSTPQPVEEDKILGDEEDAEGEADPDCVFIKWQPIPQHLDQPIPEYLAPRRKGLPPLYGGNTSVGDNPAPMRKTKIRKTDPEGNETILEILVPEGQAVDGEVVEDEAQATETLKPGTVVDGIGVVNAEGIIVAGEQAQPVPPRRRPPPPKRKAKGPGRGRRKKVMFGRNAHMAEGAERATNSVPNGEGAATPGSNVDTSAQDHEMNDDSIMHDGEDGSEEDEEEDEGDDEREEGELSPSPASPPKSPKPEGQSSEIVKQVSPSDFGKMEVDGQEDLASSPLSSPDFPLAEQNLSRKAEQSDIDQLVPEPSDQQREFGAIQESAQKPDTSEGRTPISRQEQEQGQDQQQKEGQEKVQVQEEHPFQDTADSLTDELDKDILDTPEHSKVTELVDSVATALIEGEMNDAHAFTVEEPTTSGNALVQAEIPEGTSLLDGLTAPQAPDATVAIHHNETPDGEEDLLGSLERTLHAP